VVASDNITHDKNAVIAYIIILLKKYGLPNGDVHTLNIFTDGPSSQMKNRFIYAILDNLRIHLQLRSLTWSFFASSHGKGPVDGIGGTAKRLVWRAIQTRKAFSVLNAKDFITVLEQTGTNINGILSSPLAEEEALEAVDALSVFQRAVKISDISSDHHWECSCNGITKRHPYNPTQLSSFTIIDCDTTAIIQPPITPPVTPELEDQPLNSTDSPKFESGQIVFCTLVNRKGKSKKLLASVIDVASDEIGVKFLRQKRNNVYVFPPVDDISYEPINNISKLPENPFCDRRGHFIFSENFSLFLNH
jgi:hypothetical protein